MIVEGVNWSGKNRYQRAIVSNIANNNNEITLWQN